MLIRPAIPDDALAIARIHVDAWRNTYCGLVPGALLDCLSIERREQQWCRWLRQSELDTTCTFVAQLDDSRVAGFASGGLNHGDDWDYAGELLTLYVADPFQRRGVGRALLGAVTQQLAQLGIHSIIVWSLQNKSAHSFYTSLGGVRLREQAFLMEGHRLYEVGYGWKDTTPLFGGRG
jgi:GNAT superfamily N-acetyltransferase